MFPQKPAPRYKAKIGSHLSYPLKFSEAQNLLSPAFEQLSVEVCFSAWKAPRQNETRDSYPIVEARRRGFLPPIYPEPRWQLHVHPIPKQLRPVVRSLLIPAAIDRLREWYLAAHSHVWLAGSHELRVRFIDATECLEYDEV